MRFILLLIFLVFLECSARRHKCTYIEEQGYGGNLVFCSNRRVFQYFRGKYYKIRYRGRTREWWWLPPKTDGTTDGTTEEATTTTESPTTISLVGLGYTTAESQETVAYEDAENVIVPQIGSRQLINSPKKCIGGFDALGDCVKAEDMFN